MYHIETLPDDYEKGTLSELVNGVPYTKIPYTNEYHPHATNIACYVIRFEEETPAKWLLDNMDKKGRIWHHFKFPFYEDFPEEWVGGLAQGLTISALIRMYEKTKDKTYLKGALLAYKGLKFCIKDYWIYEYPGVPSVLNGNLYALLGIWDLIKYFKIEETKRFFFKIENNISSNLSQYDIKYGWSYYDLVKKLPATRFYHKVHVALLKTLGSYTKDDVLLNYSLSWSTYLGRYNEKIANMHRLLKLWKQNGTKGMLKKQKMIKAWKVNETPRLCDGKRCP